MRALAEESQLLLLQKPNLQTGTLRRPTTGQATSPGPYARSTPNSECRTANVTYATATLVSSNFSIEIQWTQDASLVLVSNTMKFGSGGRTVAGGI